jgi:hypothetical protein
LALPSSTVHLQISLPLASLLQSLTFTSNKFPSRCLPRGFLHGTVHPVPCLRYSRIIHSEIWPAHRNLWNVTLPISQHPYFSVMYQLNALNKSLYYNITYCMCI